MKYLIVSFKRLLFLIFVACTIFFTAVGIRYFGFTSIGRQAIVDLKDMPRQWKETHENNKQIDKFYAGISVLSGFEWNIGYSGNMVVPKILIPELYQIPRIKIPAKDIYDYRFTGFVVRNIGTGILNIELYGYNSGKDWPTFGQILMRNVKNKMGEFFLGFYDYKTDEGPYSHLGGVSLPSSYGTNYYTYSIGQCVQFINEKHYGVISSDTILPGCVVKLYNQQIYDVLYTLDYKTEFNLILSFLGYYNSDNIQMSYSIEPMK